MKSRALYFNPDNDLALAAGKACYTPPKAAQDLRRSGMLLPLWLASQSDYVLIEQPYLDQAIALKSRFGLLGTPVSSLTTGKPDFAPWGWSPASARHYRLNGFHPDVIPSDESLKAVRMLSHRRSSVFINNFMDACASSPQECTTTAQALDIVAEYNSQAILKSPWSCSGRGVLSFADSARQSAISFIESSIRRQGCVMVERRLNRVADFAVLFSIEYDKVNPIGLSWFYTNHGAAYGGNIVASQDYIAARLASMSSSKMLSDAVSGATKALTSLLINNGSPYKGYAGIDMMIYTDGCGKLAIAPCIELNLRATMGILALFVASHLSPATPMSMSVGPRMQYSKDVPALDSIDLGGIAGTPFAISLSPIVNGC